MKNFTPRNYCVILTIFLLSALFSVEANGQTYCTSSGTAGSTFYVGQICLPENSPNCENCCATPGSYTDNTGSGSLKEVTPTGSNSINVGYNTNSGGPQNCTFAFYIDLNIDGDFDDPGEEYNTGTGFIDFPTGGGGIFNGSPTIPTTATNGVTRIRFIVKNGTTPVTGPCETGFNGETEDWLVTIAGAGMGGGGDTTPPNAVCMNATVQLNASGTASITTAQIDGGSTDDTGITSMTVSPNTFTCANVGANTVTLTVMDAAGNSDTCTATVTVQDNIAPTITCAADGTRNPDLGQATYTVQGTEFDPTNTNDNCPVIIRNNINDMASLAGVTIPLGSNSVIWEIEDGTGNSDNCTVVITVEYDENPVITGTANDDAIVVMLDGAEVVVTLNGVEVVRQPAANTTSITVNAGDGNDMLEVDFSGGNFNFPINYNGEGQTTAPGDIMIMSGGPTVASVTHTFVNANDGNVDVTNNGLLSYTGLEPVVDNLSVTDRVFNFTGGNETITLDAGGTLDNQIDSTLGESVDFNNPTTSLTINTEMGGSGFDNVFIEGVGAGFDADLTVNTGAGDLIRFQTNPTNVGTGNVTTTGFQTVVGSDLTTSGLGTINLEGTRRVFVGGVTTVSAVDGDITFNGNVANTTTAGAISGVDINEATIQTSGSGNISFTGNGFSAIPTTSFIHGIVVRNAGSVQALGTGSITMIGTGADGNFVNDGVRIQDTNTIVRSAGGGITLNGTGGTNTGPFNIGVSIETGATVEDVAAGDISLTGVGGTGTSGNRGVEINSASTLAVNDGNLTITGTAGAGTGNENQGILVTVSSSVTASGLGTITMDGTGGTGINNNEGIRFIGAGTAIQTNGGGMTLTGMGGAGSGIDNIGVFLLFGPTVEDIGNGAIVINGTAGSGTNRNKGVVLFPDTCTLRTNGGGMTLTGNGSITATGNDNFGVSIERGTVTDTAAGSISVTGTGGSGVNNNAGVVLVGTASNITANGGDVTVMGTGSTTATGNENYGVRMTGTTSEISTMGAGTINITGTGGTGTSFNQGIRLQDGPRINTVDGALNLIGNGGNGTANDNMGLLTVGDVDIVSTGTGAISLTGTGGQSTGFARGVVLFQNTGLVQSNGGGITIMGTADNGSTGTQNRGVSIEGTTIEDLGAGNISVTGIGGVGNDSGMGISVQNAATVRTLDGNITMNGTGGNGTGNANMGYSPTGNSTVTSSGTGAISITGMGSGTDSNEDGVNINSLVSTISGDITLTGMGSTTSAGQQNSGI